jgi:hypothetical protein
VQRVLYGEGKGVTDRANAPASESPIRVFRGPVPAGYPGRRDRQGVQGKIRHSLEIFLRFTHRYWFHEISNQVQVRDLYKMLSGHLGTEALYDEVRDEVKDMSNYLEGDTLRRQANTVVRLTVVTVFGLIGSVVTGVFGMNLFDFAGKSLPMQVVLLATMVVLVTVLLSYTLAKSKRLADFLDSVSDERLPFMAKCRALVAVWKKGSLGGQATLRESISARPLR